ncbi:MAG: DUF1192 domain-containing protein [Alphaproteobacteria bacterium]|nr:DUF1192 domain-containing protein [Alphaproteobacteria bacterium]
MAIDPEELLPRKRPEPAKLDDLSVAQLNERIGELEAEIARVKAEIAKRQAIKSGAAKLFRS